MVGEKACRLKEYPTSCHPTLLISDILNNLPVLVIHPIRLETACVLFIIASPTLSSIVPST